MEPQTVAPACHGPELAALLHWAQVDCARRQETDVEALMAKLVAEEKARSADAAVHRTALGKLEAQQDELRVPGFADKTISHC